MTDNAKTITKQASLQTKTNTGSMIGRAAVGALFAGGVGAIIGGATASRTTTGFGGSTTIKHDYKIVLTIKGVKGDIYEIKIPFFEDAGALNQASEFLTEVIKCNNLPSKSTVSLADEIIKLNQLKQSGVISELEFQQMKAKLLQ